MISTKKELSFYICADRIMNGYSKNKSIREILLRIIDTLLMHGVSDGKMLIISYLEHMRKVSFYKHQRGIFNRTKCYWHSYYYKKLGLLLGFSINPDVFGYGLVIPHYGTIVVGAPNRISNYAVLHTSTCISAKDSLIGDGLYLSTGVKITKQVTLGNGIMIGANSVVNRSFNDNQLIVGAPAKAISERRIWYEEEPIYYERVKIIERLRNNL